MRAVRAREATTVKALKACCRKEAEKSLRRHRDVATCDSCGALLLAYGNDIDYRRTMEELDNHDVDYETGAHGKLKVIAKASTR